MNATEKIEPGNHAYIGAPQTGKTWRADHDFRAFCAARSLGGIVVDSTGAKSFRDRPHVPTVELAVHVAWRGELAYITPKTLRDYESVFSAVLATEHGVPIFVDEVACWRWRQGSPIDVVARTWAHHRTSLFLTTHRVERDLATSFLQLEPRVRFFRTKVPIYLWPKFRALGVDPDALATLRDREYVTVQL